MTKVKNTYTNPIAVGSTVIPAGATVDVPEWAERKDSFAVKRMVEAGVLSPSSSEAVESAPELRVTTMQELDRLKVEYRKNAKTDDLVALLAEEKAKLEKDGKAPA